MSTFEITEEQLDALTSDYMTPDIIKLIVTTVKETPPKLSQEELVAITSEGANIINKICHHKNSCLMYDHGIDCETDCIPGVNNSRCAMRSFVSKCKHAKLLKE